MDEIIFGVLAGIVLVLPFIGFPIGLLILVNHENKKSEKKKDKNRNKEKKK